MLPFELGTIARYEFARIARGQFIAALQLKKQTPTQDIAKFLEISRTDVEKLLIGKFSISDAWLFRLCARLGADNEVSIFIEKLQKAMIPGLREGRREMASSLKLHGVTFADEDSH